MSRRSTTAAPQVCRTYMTYRPHPDSVKDLPPIPTFDAAFADMPLAVGPFGDLALSWKNNGDDEDNVAESRRSARSFERVGEWNAATNTPSLSQRKVPKLKRGAYYEVSQGSSSSSKLVLGHQWKRGDRAVFDGRFWHRVSRLHLKRHQTEPVSFVLNKMQERLKMRSHDQLVGWENEGMMRRRGYWYPTDQGADYNFVLDETDHNLRQRGAPEFVFDPAAPNTTQPPNTWTMARHPQSNKIVRLGSLTKGFRVRGVGADNPVKHAKRGDSDSLAVIASGDFYEVAEDGTGDLDGSKPYKAGDRVAWDGGTWIDFRQATLANAERQHRDSAIVNAATGTGKSFTVANLLRALQARLDGFGTVIVLAPVSAHAGLKKDFAACTGVALGWDGEALDGTLPSWYHVFTPTTFMLRKQCWDDFPGPIAMVIDEAHDFRKFPRTARCVLNFIDKYVETVFLLTATLFFKHPSDISPLLWMVGVPRDMASCNPRKFKFGARNNRACRYGGRGGDMGEANYKRLIRGKILVYREALSDYAASSRSSSSSQLQLQQQQQDGGALTKPTEREWFAYLPLSERNLAAMSKAQKPPARVSGEAVRRQGDPFLQKSRRISIDAVIDALIEFAIEQRLANAQTFHANLERYNAETGSRLDAEYDGGPVMIFADLVSKAKGVKSQLQQYRAMNMPDLKKLLKKRSIGFESADIKATLVDLLREDDREKRAFFSTESASLAEYKGMSVTQLKQALADRELSMQSKTRKADLVKLLEEADRGEGKDSSSSSRSSALSRSKQSSRSSRSSSSRSSSSSDDDDEDDDDEENEEDEEKGGKRRKSKDDDDEGGEEEEDDSENSREKRAAKDERAKDKADAEQEQLFAGLRLIETRLRAALSRRGLTNQTVHIITGEITTASARQKILGEYGRGVGQWLLLGPAGLQSLNTKNARTSQLHILPTYSRGTTLQTIGRASRLDTHPPLTDLTGAVLPVEVQPPKVVDVFHWVAHNPQWSPPPTQVAAAPDRPTDVTRLVVRRRGDGSEFDGPLAKSGALSGKTKIANVWVLRQQFKDWRLLERYNRWNEEVSDELMHSFRVHRRSKPPALGVIKEKEGDADDDDDDEEDDSDDDDDDYITEADATRNARINVGEAAGFLSAPSRFATNRCASLQINPDSCPKNERLQPDGVTQPCGAGRDCRGHASGGIGNFVQCARPSSSSSSVAHGARRVPLANPPRTSGSKWTDAQCATYGRGKSGRRDKRLSAVALSRLELEQLRAKNFKYAECHTLDASQCSLPARGARPIPMKLRLCMVSEAFALRKRWIDQQLQALEEEAGGARAVDVDEAAPLLDAKYQLRQFGGDTELCSETDEDLVQMFRELGGSDWDAWGRDLMLAVGQEVGDWVPAIDRVCQLGTSVDEAERNLQRAIFTTWRLNSPVAHDAFQEAVQDFPDKITLDVANQLPQRLKLCLVVAAMRTAIGSVPALEGAVCDSNGDVSALQALHPDCWAAAVKAISRRFTAETWEDDLFVALTALTEGPWAKNPFLNPGLAAFLDDRVLLQASSPSRQQQQQQDPAIQCVLDSIRVYPQQKRRSRLLACLSLCLVLDAMAVRADGLKRSVDDASQVLEEVENPNPDASADTMLANAAAKADAKATIRSAKTQLNKLSRPAFSKSLCNCGVEQPVFLRFLEQRSELGGVWWQDAVASIAVNTTHVQWVRFYKDARALIKSGDFMTNLPATLQLLEEFRAMPIDQKSSTPRSQSSQSSRSRYSHQQKQSALNRVHRELDGELDLYLEQRASFLEKRAAPARVPQTVRLCILNEVLRTQLPGTQGPLGKIDSCDLARRFRTWLQSAEFRDAGSPVDSRAWTTILSWVAALFPAHSNDPSARTWQSLADKLTEMRRRASSTPGARSSSNKTFGVFMSMSALLVQDVFAEQRWTVPAQAAQLNQWLSDFAASHQSKAVKARKLSDRELHQLNVALCLVNAAVTQATRLPSPLEPILTNNSSSSNEAPAPAEADGAGGDGGAAPKRQRPASKITVECKEANRFRRFLIARRRTEQEAALLAAAADSKGGAPHALSPTWEELVSRVGSGHFVLTPNEETSQEDAWTDIVNELRALQDANPRSTAGAPKIALVGRVLAAQSPSDRSQLSVLLRDFSVPETRAKFRSTELRPPKPPKPPRVPKVKVPKPPKPPKAVKLAPIGRCYNSTRKESVQRAPWFKQADEALVADMQGTLENSPMLRSVRDFVDQLWSPARELWFVRRLTADRSVRAQLLQYMNWPALVSSMRARHNESAAVANPQNLLDDVRDMYVGASSEWPIALEACLQSPSSSSSAQPPSSAARRLRDCALQLFFVQLKKDWACKRSGEEVLAAARRAEESWQEQQQQAAAPQEVIM